MKQGCFSGFCCMKCKKWGWLPMTHIESLETKIKIINYAALCKRQPVLKLPLYSQIPPPHSHSRCEKENRWAAVLEGFCGFGQHSRSLLEKLSLVRRKGSQRGEAMLLPLAPRRHGPRELLPNAQVWLDGWTGALVKLFSSSGPYTSQPVVPAIHARLRLPSRFRKLLGLTFISANWMECSWPFQWNQLTP